MKEGMGSATLHELCELIQRLLDEASSTSTYNLLGRFVPAAATRLGLPTRRLALLSSFTLEPLLPYLQTHLLLRGWSMESLCLPYQQWQAALGQGDELDAFDPTDVFLLIHPEDMLRQTHVGFLSHSREDRSEHAEHLLSLLLGLVDSFRGRSQANVAIAGLSSFTTEPERYANHTAQNNRRLFIERFNAELATRIEAVPGVYLYPYHALVADVGRRHWFDPVKNNLYQTAIRSTALPELARDLAGFLDNLWAPRKKCVVVDLDNTLWGGIVGEDGLEGILLGDEGVGRAYRDFQQFLKELHVSGVLLAINSRNNPEDARKVFDEHPSCVLSWDDFAATRVNWGDKARNIVELTEELNIGIDSLIFVDDSPMECGRVAEAHPAIDVIQFVDPPELMPDRILRSTRLQPPLLSADDLRRNESYQSEKTRVSLRETLTDYEQYLESLGLELSMEMAESADIPRLAQLAAKTNQFNTTTTRYTLPELSDALQDPGAILIKLALRDRYGDYGVIGMLLLRSLDDQLHIENYLMSCRVLGRRIEEAVIAVLQRLSVARNADLVGHFRASQRNQQVQDLYPRFGFEECGESAESGRLFRWAATQPPRGWPRPVTIITNVTPSEERHNAAK